MKNAHLSLLLTLFGGMVGTAPAAMSQTATVIYTLDNVWLDPDITHPHENPQLMTGTIEWTYTIGDFENGSGEFLQLNLPWHNGNGPALSWNVEADQIEITMQGNWHDWGADASLKLTQPLTPDQPAPIDTVFSSFDIEAFGISRKGHVISGSVVPEPTFTAYCFGDASGQDCPCGNLGVAGEGCANSTGAGAVLGAVGSTSVASDDLRLVLSQMPNGQSGIFYMGGSANEAPFGDGLRCVGSGGVGIYRFLPPQNSGSTGQIELGPGLVGLSQSFSTNGQIDAGETWYFQGWFRDPMGPCGSAFNLSNGLAVTFAP